MTLCLKNPPLIPFGLLTDPYFQREVLGHEALTSHSEVAAVIATAAEFIQQLADALKNFGMAMLGAFKEVIQKVFETVKKVVQVIESFIKWAIEKVLEAINAVIKAIKSAIKKVVDTYKQLIQTIAEWIDSGGPQELARSIEKAVVEFIKLVFEGSMVLMAVFLTATAVLVAVKVATLGLGAFVSQILYQTVLKDAIFTIILAAAMTGTFYELGSLFKRGDNPDTGLKTIVSFLGISGVAMESIYLIGDAFINAAKGKIGIIGYYFGIFLTFTGMLAEAATETMSGDMLLTADAIAAIISGLGLIYSLYVLKEDISTKAHEELSPLMTGIELAIGISGVVNSVAKYTADSGGA